MGKFVMNPNFITGLNAEFDTQIDKFDRKLLREMRGKVKLGTDIKYKPKYGGGGKRDPRHLKNTGHIIEAEDGVGGVQFDSDHAIFVEKGHRVGGAAAGQHGPGTGGYVRGKFFMLRTLEDHRAEIENGSFLKKGD